MTDYQYPFVFSEGASSRIAGSLQLSQPLPIELSPRGSGLFRTGSIVLESGESLELVLYHTPATAAFIYLRETTYDQNLFAIAGLPDLGLDPETVLTLPGQLCMGSERTELIGSAVQDLISAPPIHTRLIDHHQQNVAVFPIAREGLKYQVAEGLFNCYNFYCDEILLDAHHVFDSSVPVYSRKVELGLFKDKDLDKEQRENITTAFIADSIASGLVMKEVIARIRERFAKINYVEVIAPLATIRGLCRIAQSEIARETTIRVHVFETLLNALPPDYYYSAHFDIPQLHIRPDLEEAYRKWWGLDHRGQAIADTACAGYGWSEVFYSPRKQIQMMNSELMTRHQMSIAEIIQRSIREPAVP